MSQDSHLYVDKCAQFSSLFMLIKNDCRVDNDLLWVKTQSRYVSGHWKFHKKMSSLDRFYLFFSCAITKERQSLGFYCLFLDSLLIEIPIETIGFSCLLKKLLHLFIKIRKILCNLFLLVRALLNMSNKKG